VVGLVVATLLAMASLGITAGGVALLVGDSWLRDDSGFVMSGEQQVSTPTYALTSDSLEIDAAGPARVMPEALLGDVKLAVDSDVPVFVGIAATRDVEAFLDDVRHEAVVDPGDPPAYRLFAGGAASVAPQTQDFWVAQVAGSGEQALTWDVEGGSWTVVVMNTDTSAGVAADVAVGAELPALGWLVPLLLSVGATGLVVAAVWLTVLIRAASRR
jgi:hypothetical protein